MKSKITSKYQTTIPKEVREKLKLSVSDSIEWEVENDKIVIKPAKSKILNFMGIIKVGKGNIKNDIKKASDLMTEDVS
ncbi:MAG: AbrB/MazE/SpoVT family DNA-binding domain-containing protein [Spirochaetia bacterium]|nr:AbrB/MazE/SpoVT family DNA-binding domain-containing protein [Spirochaetia bacterium]